MCAKRGDRVAHGRTELNGEALDGVGVVAAPDLRGIIQHAGIETSAAAGAVFKEDIRKRFDKTIHEVVCTEHEAVHDLLLALRREQRRADLGQIAVEVPFDVINLIFTEDFIHLREDIIAHVFSRHIEDVLQACGGVFTVRHVQAPIRVGAVEVAVRRDHLRLIPDAEL